MKYVIKNYISVHISTFSVSFLEGWVILNFLFPTNPYGAPKRVKMCVLIKINATIKSSSKIMNIYKILPSSYGFIGNGKF